MLVAVPIARRSVQNVEATAAPKFTSLSLLSYNSPFFMTIYKTHNFK